MPLNYDSKIRGNYVLSENQITRFVSQRRAVPVNCFGDEAINVFTYSCFLISNKKEKVNKHTSVAFGKVSNNGMGKMRA